MNTLYLVRLYNHRLNQWARFLLTLPEYDLERAGREAQSALTDEWRVRTTTSICTTTDDVFTEL